MRIPAPDHHTIAIEGLPGSGHEAFARWAGQREDWYAVLEESDSRLPPIERGALSHVLQRLIGRYECCQSLSGIDLFRRRVVMDHIFETHALWAQCLLTDNEWNIYQKVARVMTETPLRPDVVIFFQAPEREIVAALRRRHRGVDADRWRSLCRSYQQYFFSYDQSPLLVVRRNSEDGFDGIGTRENLWDKILTYQGGQTYFFGESGLWDGGRPAGD